MKRMVPSVPFALVLVAGLSISAAAGVDVTIENAAKVQGSITSADARDTYRIECPAGATLKVKAKGKKGLRPEITVRRPVVAAEPAKAETVSDGPLPVSGQHLIEIGGGAGSTGDYTLAVSFKLPKKTTTTVTLGQVESVVPFAADAGTVLKVKVKAAKGSEAVPQIRRVEGPDGYRLDLVPTAKPASASLGKTVLPSAGDYRLILADAGDLGGDAAVTLQRKQAKPAKRKLDLRSRAIGDPGGERLAVSDVVDDQGGAVGVPFADEGGPDSVIGGSNVLVPAGALSEPTPIVVATSSTVKPKGNAVGAGPSVFFGPEGLTFSQDVAVTIPFDAAQFGGDLSALQVFTRDAKGKVRLVDGPYDVDTDSGTCTFQVAHFSSFRAARAVAGGGGGGTPAELVGVWRQITELEPTALAWLIISGDGTVESVVASTENTICGRATLPTEGVPLSFIFEVVGGNLRFIDDNTLLYEPAVIGDVPTGCDEVQLATTR